MFETLAIFAAGGAVIATAAYFTLPRWPEDYFERDLAELASYTASGPPYAAPLAGGLHNTPDDHQPDSGAYSDVESSGSPPPIHHSDLTPMGPKDGAASPCPVGGPVAFYSVEGCGVAAQSVRSRWPRPVLFRVK
ncbi:MAG TPA: hypothetical protein VK862_14815 [Afifellaceae bacterium]|nr:hypothetical protein [Afifellaceae bacterium]